MIPIRERLSAWNYKVSDSTYAGAWEAFDDPTFLLGFECFDLLLDEIDDDVVRHVRVCAPLIDDSLSVLAFLADFLVEEVAN